MKISRKLMDALVAHARYSFVNAEGIDADLEWSPALRKEGIPDKATYRQVLRLAKGERLDMPGNVFYCLKPKKGK